MSKVRLFTENFIVYGIGGVIGRIVPLIMLPIVTRLMPDASYFGINDLSASIVSFATSFAIMGMYDAMFRMFFEKDSKDFKIKVCSTSLFFTIITSICISILLIVFKDLISYYFYTDKKYSYLIYLCAISTLIGGTNSIVSAPSRMENKKKTFLVLNIVSSIVSYSVSIPLLLKGYYVIALPVAGVITAFLNESVFLFINRKWFSLITIDIKLLKSMLQIALPIFPGFIIYWIFSSCDKLMITNMLGLKYAGLYAVGSKLGHCSNLIYTAFAGGWQYFSFSTMNDENQARNNSRIFEYLGIISFMTTLCICAIAYKLYYIVFTQEYLESYIVSPYLFLSPLILMLYQVQANQFLIMKKTWPTLIILISGALANIILNYILIPIFSIEGAAISTLFGYAITAFLSVVILTKLKMADVSFKFYVSIVVFILCFILWRLRFSTNLIIGSIMCVMYLFVLYILYFSELNDLIIKKAIRKLRK